MKVSDWNANCFSFAPLYSNGRQHWVIAVVSDSSKTALRLAVKAVNRSLFNTDDEKLVFDTSKQVGHFGGGCYYVKCEVSTQDTFACDKPGVSREELGCSLPTLRPPKANEAIFYIRISWDYRLSKGLVKWPTVGDDTQTLDAMGLRVCYYTEWEHQPSEDPSDAELAKFQTLNDFYDPLKPAVDIFATGVADVVAPVAQKLVMPVLPWVIGGGIVAALLYFKLGRKTG